MTGVVDWRGKKRGPRMMGACGSVVGVLGRCWCPLWIAGGWEAGLGGVLETRGCGLASSALKPHRIRHGSWNYYRAV